MAEANIYDFQVKNAKNENVSLDKYRGKTLLIVNVASKCGFTPQYKGLQDLYVKNAGRGLEILGSEAIKWNFTKFLVDKNGKIIKRYAPTDTPEAIGKDLESIL